jgi:hypothetical protein
LGIKTCIIKIRKIACKSLKGRGAESGLRIVYAHYLKKQELFLLNFILKVIKRTKIGKEYLNTSNNPRLMKVRGMII